jgi:stage III sporulation protein SpoIIIAA
MLLADDLNQLLNILPQYIQTPLKITSKKEQLLEIVLDIGRRPEARFSDGAVYLSYQTIVWQDLDYILKRLGKFSGDNRAGIEKTLHRISSLRNRQGSVIGLTCRIGRALFGTVSIIRDLLEHNKSILILGKPGVGKTTAIREIARVLSDGMKKRVIIIDTSNEIAGDGDLPHPSIGKARRMQVSTPQNQHYVMIEAVENHMPEIIIIDEIGTELEAAAARTIAERGVQLVGTAHGTELENLIKNPTLTDLIGGIQNVTLGDEEAKRRGSSKSILERKGPSTFDVAVEIHDAKTWFIHENIEQSVDLLLQGNSLSLQKRTLISSQNNFVKCELVLKQKETKNIQDNSNYYKKTNLDRKQKTNFLFPKVNVKLTKPETELKNKNKFIFLYAYGINAEELKKLIKTLDFPIIVTKEIQYASAILALSNLAKNNKKLKQICHSRKISLHTIRSTSLIQISKALRVIFKNSQKLTELNSSKEVISRLISKGLLTPLEEARLVIEEIIIPRKLIVELFPRVESIRKLQHELISFYQLKGVSVGKDCNRRIRIYPN